LEGEDGGVINWAPWWIVKAVAGDARYAVRRRSRGAVQTIRVVSNRCPPRAKKLD
jgi:hypothetical protein